VSRFDRPEELGLHLEENARALEAILDGTDASPLVVFGRLEALARSWSKFHREVLAGYGINYAELSTLGLLRTASTACSPGELRTLVGQTSAGMTRILDKLETEGLVRRVAHAEDGRRVEVRLTPRGAALAEECLAAVLAAESELLSGWSKRRRDALVLGIDALLAAFANRRSETSKGDDGRHGSS
jgi:DNA-binding MarR family transcriptional regulator